MILHGCPPLQGVEHDDVIDAVEELEGEGLLPRLLHVVPVGLCCSLPLALVPKPTPVPYSCRSRAPMLEVMMMMLLRKSILSA